MGFNIVNTERRNAYVSANSPDADKQRENSLMLSRSPVAKAVVSKLHKDNKFDYQHLPSIGGLSNISARIADNERIYQQIQQELPDIKHAKILRASMILSPSDLTNVYLNYSCDTTELPDTLIRKMINTTANTFGDSEYDFTRNLKRITEDMIADTGSHALAVIPEPSVDDIINNPSGIAIEKIDDRINRLKSSKKSIGIFAKSVAIESIKYESDTNIGMNTPTAESLLGYKITEDIENIQIGYLRALRNDYLANKKYSHLHPELDTVITGNSKFGNEDANQLEIAKFKREIFGRKPGGSFNAIKINETDWENRPAVGHPITIHYPSRCIIPIHLPGDTSTHLGFLVLTGQDNSPITSPYPSRGLGGLMSGTGYDSTNYGADYRSVISSIDKYQNGTSCSYGSGFDVNELLQLARRIIEDDVTDRLYNGTYNSSSYRISCPENVALIMLSHRIAGLQVNLQFIPATLMTYFALQYDELGVGRSCIEDIKMIASLRSALTLAGTMAGIRNSIGVTKLNVGADELDNNIKQSVDEIMQRIVSVRSMTGILNNGSPTSTMNFLASAMMQVKITMDGESNDGSVKPIPGTTVEISEEQPNYPGPDEDLMEDLRDRSIIGMGVPSELLDAMKGVDFATGIVYNNQMLNKQTSEDQQILNGHITQHFQQFMMNSGKVMAKFASIIKEETEMLRKHVGDKQLTIKDVVDIFVSNLRVTLPVADNTKYVQQLESLTTYVNMVDLAVERCIQDGIIGKIVDSTNQSDSSSETGTSLDEMVRIIKMDLIRNYMQKNGILPELFALFDDSDDSRNLADIVKNYVSETDVLSSAYNEIKRQIMTVMQKTEAANTANEGNAPDGGGSEFDTPPSSSGGSDNFDFGGGSGNDDIAATTVETDTKTTEQNNTETNDGDDIDDPLELE